MAWDPEYSSMEEGFGSSFSEKSVRMAFIRKVYGILMVQLSITVAFICLFLYVESIKLYTQEHSELFIVAIVLIFILMIAMACFDTLRRKFPLNFICLFVFTILESFVLGAAASTYDKDLVLWAVAICAFICLALTIFAFQTKTYSFLHPPSALDYVHSHGVNMTMIRNELSFQKSYCTVGVSNQCSICHTHTTLYEYDFTMMGGMLFVALLILLVFGFLCIFLSNRIADLVYACLGALVFSLYLVYDTQLLIGGGHKYSISPEEYIFGALNLYLDIINLFLFILQILAASRD